MNPYAYFILELQNEISQIQPIIFAYSKKQYYLDGYSLTKQLEICKLLHFYGLVNSEGQLKFSKKRKFQKEYIIILRNYPRDY